MPSAGPLEIALVALFILVPVALIARFLLGPSRLGRSERDPALDALRTRLARGEIDEGEFERLRSLLQRA